MDEITSKVAIQQNVVNQPIGCSTICVNEPDCVSACFTKISVKKKEKIFISIIICIGNFGTYGGCIARGVKPFLHCLGSHN